MSKHSKKSKRILKLIVLIVVLVILATIGYGIYYVAAKFGKINFQALDKSDLGINENLYNEVSGNMSQKEYDSIINILLIGSDSENGYDKEKHSDVIMIFSLNPVKKSIKLISIPRDVATDIENYKRFKLNKSYALGGEQLLIKSINSTFGLTIDEYITIDFEGMIDVINRIGGIEMDITYQEMVYINSGLKLMYKISDNDYRTLKTYGKVTLNGEQAMVHARNRSTANDIARTEKHRDVLTAIINKISSKTGKEILDLSDYILDDVTTNADVMGYLSMLPNFIMEKDRYLGNITSVLVPSMDYSKGQMVNGAYLIETDIDKAKADFRKYMYEM